ncbi:hypothetical protein ACFL4K_00810 [Candidatus Neomarinimicrobiota bacterium]
MGPKQVSGILVNLCKAAQKEGLLNGYRFERGRDAKNWRGWRVYQELAKPGKALQEIATPGGDGDILQPILDWIATFNNVRKPPDRIRLDLMASLITAGPDGLLRTFETVRAQPKAHPGMLFRALQVQGR